MVCTMYHSSFERLCLTLYCNTRRIRFRQQFVAVLYRRQHAVRRRMVPRRRRLFTNPFGVSSASYREKHAERKPQLTTPTSCRAMAIYSRHDGDSSGGCIPRTSSFNVLQQYAVLNTTISLPDEQGKTFVQERRVTHHDATSLVASADVAADAARLAAPST